MVRFTLYDSILETDPKNVEAQQARDNAKLLARLSAADSTDDPIAHANANPADISAAFAAADAEIAAGAAEAAFNRLLLLLPQAGEQKTEVKDRILELFALFDASDPRVLAARAKLASALF